MAFPQWYYDIRNAPIRGLTKFMIWLSRVLPTENLFKVARWLGGATWMLLPKWRSNALKTIDIFYQGQLSIEERKRIGKAAAINLAYHIFEFIRMGQLDVDEVMKMVECVEGKEHYEKALEKGNGAIGLAMHYGNWELSGAYLTQHIGQLYAVGKKQSDPFFTQIAFPWRDKFGIKNIMAGDRSSSAILRALKENAILGLLADINGGTTGIFAPFAGTMASNVPGPAVLALKKGAPLIVTYCKRIAPGRHKLIIKPPLDLSGLPEDKDSAVVEILSRINSAYEAVIKEDPTQWLWGHKRYKTRPEGEESLY